MKIFSLSTNPQTQLIKAMPIILAIFLLIGGFAILATKVSGFRQAGAPALPYSWVEATKAAAFPGSYNFPVFIAQQRIWAFHPEGIWVSTDAKKWEKSQLPAIRQSAYDTRYVQFKNAIYALGKNQGNYLNIKFDSTIRRTSDFQKWEVVAEKSELPNRVFQGTLVFANKIWLFGGFDGKNYYHDVWNSVDGVHWSRVASQAEWTPRTIPSCVVFKNRMWILGGGVIDGHASSNTQSDHEIWSSADGIHWSLEADQTQVSGNSPIVFDNKLWVVGANRDGTFSRAFQVTEDGVNWKEAPAPWTPRGGVATWIFDGKLYMTGGKYSVRENGDIKFIYSNDVWYLKSSQS